MCNLDSLHFALQDIYDICVQILDERYVLDQEESRIFISSEEIFNTGSVSDIL